jgi:hypothetical protein
MQHPGTHPGSSALRRIWYVSFFQPSGRQQDFPNAVEAMMKYDESLQRAGVPLARDGLYPLAMGARISFSGRKAAVSYGPFPERNCSCRWG